MLEHNLQAKTFINSVITFMQHMQVSGQSAVGITNTTFLGNLNANAQGGAICVGSQGLVQVHASRWVFAQRC